MLTLLCETIIVVVIVVVIQSAGAPWHIQLHSLFYFVLLLPY